MITAGIDSGAKNTKAVIVKDGKIVGKGLVLTGFDQKGATRTALEQALSMTGIPEDDIDGIAGTGSGKDMIHLADYHVNQIRSMGKGARYFFPGARTVVDVGAEEVMAARLDEKGSTLDFAINEKCASGAGAFIEAMGRALDTSVEEIGLLALQSSQEIYLNAQCVIFAESEVVGLIHAKADPRDISKAIHDAVARRIVSMIRRVGLNEDVVMLGGAGRNPGLVKAMELELGLDKIFIPDEPEYGVALGAAIMASECP